jgi:hypothetical protein
MRWIAKLLGLVALLVAAGTLGLMLAAGVAGLAVTQALGQLWFAVDPGSLNLSQALIERGLWPPLWDHLVFPVLRQPAPLVALVAAVVTLLLFWLGRTPGHGGGHLKRKRMFKR